MSTYAGSPIPLLTPGEQASYHYDQRQQTRKGRTPTTSLDVEAIGHVANLVTVFELMRRQNGPTPGPDGLSYPHLGRRELFSVFRPVSRAIIGGTYQPGPARSIKIAKSNGKGTRTLTVRNLIDRVVAKALNEALTPLWEQIYLTGSHGFRPGHSHLTLLAQLERMMVEQGRWVIVSDDIKAAFDSVQIDLVLDDHRRHLSNNNLLLRLVEVVLRGGEPTRKVGIGQGCPYSPTALNVHLHHVLDAQAHAPGVIPGTSTPWLRYADNIVVPCLDVREGQQVLSRVAVRLATAGIALKGDNGGLPVDLRRGTQVQLLGFTIFRQGNKLCYKIGPEAWDDLPKSLLRAHEATDPSRAANAAISGWIASHGPAFQQRQNRLVDHLLHVASSFGFREIFDREVYEGERRTAWLRWRALVRNYDRTTLAEDQGINDG